MLILHVFFVYNKQPLMTSPHKIDCTTQYLYETMFIATKIFFIIFKIINLLTLKLTYVIRNDSYK